MARVDYYSIEQAIRTQLLADAGLSNITVTIEEELSFQRGDIIAIFLDRRDAPAEEQTLSAGTHIRMHLKFSIWCFHFGLVVADSIERRDDLLGKVELALMRDRTFSGAVNSSWITGGEFQTGEVHSEAGMGFSGWGSGAEVELIAEMTGTT